jgi:hypothetical protein
VRLVRLVLLVVRVVVVLLLVVVHLLVVVRVTRQVHRHLRETMVAQVLYPVQALQVVLAVVLLE